MAAWNAALPDAGLRGNPPQIHLMPASIEQHQVEIERNAAFWKAKPLLRSIYTRFYEEIRGKIDPAIPGRVVEIGSGIGNLKQHLREALCTDLFPNPWLDLVCDACHLPFTPGSVSHLVLFDVFHHLQRPVAFLNEAQRVLTAGGRIILIEPYISAASWAAYGLFHHEPVAWRAPIEFNSEPPSHPAYYAAQGNATRLFFQQKKGWLPAGLSLVESRAFVSFTYLLSGGFSKPALIPEKLFPVVQRLDRVLSPFPRIFGARCLVVLRKS
jgi:SAM-dependent methyltransferase